MAELRCPNCGKINPDILDVCQFCQAPLKPESVLRIGDSPTKKNTGELESVLPDWLRDVRQQARDLAEEDAAAQTAANSKVQKNEPPDLLAGLASQASSSNEEEIPDWLASINPGAKSKSAAPSKPAPESDFFAQFSQSQAKPASESTQEDAPSRMGDVAGQPPSSQEKDELSEWFVKTSEQPEEVVELDSDAQHDAASASNFESPLPSRQESAPKEEEDLSWLHNLEEEAKQTGDLKAPKQSWMANFETPSTPSQPSTSQGDLSWLDSLGGIEEPTQEVPSQPNKSKDDLNWLNNLGTTQEPLPPHDAAPDKPISSQPFASAEDLNWLNSLGGAAEPSQPFNAPVPDASVASDKPFEEDLSWLNDLGGESEPLATPPFAASGIEATSPRQTAPLGNKDAQEETEPDWLKSATEAPSMPAPGDLSMDWFQATSQPADEKPVSPSETMPASRTPQPPPFSDIFSTPSEPSSLSNPEVDSLFAMEMPDWLSRPEPGTTESASPQSTTPPVEGEESLAPVDLPSWVQAMRPVEAVISETATSTEDRPEEKEGPLAGLRGVIPSAPIGSSRRPKAIALKLQATDEQQASAVLLEQILGSETSPRALITSSFITSQHVLRWAITGLFLIVLSAVVVLRSQIMPVSANLPIEGSNISNAVTSIPTNGKVLVVIDYEPSLAGEMEAIGGPMLNQMVLSSHPNLSFISTSPNGFALVERLMSSAKINKPAPDGFGYQAGTQYLNLGYLPGGAAGALGFVERPAEVIPTSGVGSFSDYAALIVMTDHAESGRVWVEQLQNRKQIDPALTNKPLLMIASAQAGPLLQPYVASGQITGMISGLSDAARYEAVKNIPSGIARSYWDTFGVGLMMAIALIVIGSLWSLFTGIRARRAESEQG